MLKTVRLEKKSRPAGRIYNFGAGPATLPAEVLQQAQAEILDWQGTGMSVMEISHRSEKYIEMAAQTEADLRALLAIPQNYKVLFLQGGATGQFAMVPQNLLREKTTADYLHTGHWSGKALQEARRFCKVNVALSIEDNGYTSIPAPEHWRLDPDAAYVYYTENETIHGVEFHALPETGGMPLVSDMTSSLLSHPLDLSRYGIVFASAQKNIGPAGLVVVILCEDLSGGAPHNIPAMSDYAVHVQDHSMYNTPPTWSWYLAGLVLRWTLAQGGVHEMEKRALRRSEKLYRVIDGSGFYRNPVAKEHRSRMNVPFTLADAGLNAEFLAAAEARGLTALRGHRSVGGMRASIYNAMPEAGVDMLVEFMQDFERRYG
ncbi:MAG: 3-phosphoserine/phosphohydroxythreonine transaminase [Gammaproteobacteria bacterium]